MTKLIDVIVPAKIDFDPNVLKNLVFDYDKDEIQEFMVKFKRRDLAKILVEGMNTVTITGYAGNYHFSGIYLGGIYKW